MNKLKDEALKTILAAQCMIGDLKLDASAADTLLKYTSENNLSPDVLEKLENRYLQLKTFYDKYRGMEEIMEKAINE